MPDNPQPQKQQNKDAHWRAFTDNTTDEQARAAFVKRYGVEPAQIIRRGGIVLVGPLPE